MIDTFRKIVESSKQTIVENLGLEVLYKHYGFAPKNPYSYGRNELSNLIYSRIQNTLKLDEQKKVIKRHDILKIQSYFVQEHFFSGTNKDPYYYIITKLIHISKSDECYVCFSETQRWIDAVSLLKDLIILTDSDIFDDETFISFYNKEFEIANAAKYFHEKGYAITLELEGFTISEESKAAWIKSIKEDVRKLGGESFLYSLFSHIKSTYYSNYNRYLIYRNIGDPINPTKPALPLGFLLNIGIQYIGTYEHTGKESQSFSRVLEEVTKFVTLYDVQPYHLTDDLFYTPYNFIECIVKLILYDNIYLFTQLDYKYLPFLLDNLFSFVDPDIFKGSYGFTIAEFTQVTKDLMSIKENYNIKINPDTFNSKVERGTFKKILDCLAIENKLVNSDYNFPEDFNVTNFLNYPLVRFHEGYFLADKSWCSSAFITRLAILCDALYSDDKKKMFWSSLGFSVEDAIGLKLTEGKIPFKKGKYKFKSSKGEIIEGECDFVIEGETKIIFIETKNKSLTKEARSGGQVEILYDLLSSVVSEIEQSARHKFVIQKDGKITFLDGTEVYLEGRGIERVGISFEDFGGFQSRLPLIELLRNLHISEIHVYGDKVDSRIKKNIAKTLEKFKKSISNLVSLNDDHDRKQFFDCHFFSLPMLFLMIENSTTTESFINELLSNKHIAFTSKDFYIEYKSRKTKFL